MAEMYTITPTDLLRSRNLLPSPEFPDWAAAYGTVEANNLAPFDAILILHVAWRQRRLLRAARSTEKRIGDTWADYATQTVRMVRDIWTVRLLTVAVAALAGLILGFAIVPLIGSVLVALFVGGRKRIWIPAMLLPILIDPRSWWIVVLAAIGLYFVHTALEIGRMIRSENSMPPYAAQVFTLRDRLVNIRQWLQISPPIDAAFNKNALFAQRFWQRRTVASGRWTAVSIAVEALVDTRRSSVGDALRRVHEAEELCRSGSQADGSLALIELARGEICLLAHQLLPACDAFIAATRDVARRRGRTVSVHARRRIVECLAGLDRVDDALEELTFLRWTAMRTGDINLLKWTETYVVRLMLDVGNIAGAVTAVPYFADARSDVRNIMDGADELTARHLVVATVLMEADRLGIERDIDVQVPAESAEYQVKLALSRLADDPHPRLAAAAYNLWALLERAENGVTPVMVQRLLVAVRYSERLRVMMPRSAWRENWVEALEHVYQEALDAASVIGDHAAIVELIEIVRAQPEPRHRSDRSALIALLDASTSLSSAEPWTIGDDPLDTPVSLQVDGFSAIRVSDTAGVDLRDCLDRVAKGSWYFAAAIVRDTLWWSFLTPEREQQPETLNTGRVSLSDPNIREALRDLYAALPVLGDPVATDLDAQGNPRYLGGPLVTDLGPDGDGEEFHLLRGVSAALLPKQLRDYLQKLSRCEPRCTLVVGLSGMLNAVPLAALPIDITPLADPNDFLFRTRLIEVADIVHIPAWASVASHAALAMSDTERTARQHPAPVRLAVMSPDPSSKPISAIELPHSTVTLTGNVDKEAFRQALLDLRGAEPSTVYLACHGVAGEDLPGLKFADSEPLTLREILKPTPDGPRYPMPERVVTSACESAGAKATITGRAMTGEDLLGISVNREWLGFPTAALAVGAVHTVVTRYPIDDQSAAAVDAELLDAFAHSPTPWQEVGKVQRNQLEAWRRGEDIQPLTWQAYCYVGYGTAG